MKHKQQEKIETTELKLSAFIWGKEVSRDASKLAKMIMPFVRQVRLEARLSGLYWGTCLGFLLAYIIFVILGGI